MDLVDLGVVLASRVEVEPETMEEVDDMAEAAETSAQQAVQRWLGGRPDMPPGSGFPSSLGKVATRALAAEGLTGFDQLPQRTERELLALHGVGPKAIRILGEELEARGLRFRDG